jgi:dipeptidyl aminopeptidase/acylaminoacyl peptidase
MLLLPVVTHAAPTGEIIFRHPKDYRELWIGNTNDGRSARPLFKLPHDITAFSIQKDGRYIVAVVKIKGKDEFDSFHDVYLLDRENPNIAAKKLTQGQYREIIDAAISPDKDVIFTNHSWELRPGVYLIPNHEIEKKNPKAKLLRQLNAYEVDWASDGKKIAYSTDAGILTFNPITKEISRITKHDDFNNFPVFSSNSKQLAFLARTKPFELGKLGIVSVVGHHNLRYIEPEEGVAVEHLTWSVDGEYLVYTMYNDWDPAFTNFAVHLESGVTERVLETYSNGGLWEFEWATRRYALEPEGLLTTVWGKIKQKK